MDLILIYELSLLIWLHLSGLFPLGVFFEDQINVYFLSLVRRCSIERVMVQWMRLSLIAFQRWALLKLLLCMLFWGPLGLIFLTVYFLHWCLPSPIFEQLIHFALGIPLLLTSPPMWRQEWMINHPRSLRSEFEVLLKLSFLLLLMGWVDLELSRERFFRPILKIRRRMGLGLPLQC